MCAINPIHKKRFIIDVYTSIQMTNLQFEVPVITALLEKELELNSNYPKFRFHIKESKQQAE